MIKIGSNSKLTQVIVFCLVFAFFLLLLHLLVGRPIIKYANKIKSEWKSKQVQLQEAENLIKILPNPRKAIEEVEKKFSDLSDVGVTRKQIPRMVQLLGKSTVENNIKVLSLKPREDIKSTNDNLPAGVSKAYFELELNCTYKEFGEYVKVLPGLQPGFTIESVEMQKSAQTTASRSPLAEKPQAKQQEQAKPREAKDPPLIIRLVVSTYMVWEL
jgi:Tfp pilus assembly protein PilO